MGDHGVAMGEFEQPILAGADASQRLSPADSNRP
jgi:hypothetical protein